MMSPSPDEGKLYGDNHMATMIQAMIDKVASAKFESVNFEIFAPVLGESDRSTVGHRRCSRAGSPRGENGGRQGYRSKLKA